MPHTPAEPANSLRLRLDHPVPGCVVAEITGEVDLATAPRLHAALYSALDMRSLAVLFVDLSRVEFLAVAGVRVLLDVHRQARQQGVELRLIASQRAVLRPIALLGLSELFEVRTPSSIWPAQAVDGARGEETSRGDGTGEQVDLLGRVGDHGAGDPS